MKKLLFFLVLVPTLFAQKVIGDTTDLKLYDGSGIVILEQYGGSTWDLTGGGLFHYIDSTYSEGTHAFNHPISGKQWARLGAFGLVTSTEVQANELSLDSLVSIGTDVFTTTAVKDTVIISGAEASDSYFIQPISETLDAQDIQFQTVSKVDTLIVTRPSSGASALRYHYLRIKKH